MAGSKSKISKEETESEVGVEKKKAATMEDRLSNLPEALQFRILSCLDASQAVQTSVLSKTWVLSSRDPLATLDTLKYKVFVSSSAETLKTVFHYAISHGVKHLEASIQRLTGNGLWPVSVCDSLTSLKLHNHLRARRPFQGPIISIFSKNLSVLYLHGALITDVEPFSGFPVLERLTLLFCHLSVEGNNNKTLKVHALRLLHLKISNCTGVNCFELKTPSLRFLEYQGSNILKHEGLTVLETLKIDFNGFRYYRGKEGEKRLIDDLMSLFCTLPNVKSLTVFSATVVLLFLFPNELKDLTLDLSGYHLPRLVHNGGTGWFESVKAYLLQNSPHAKFTFISPTIRDWLTDDLF